MNITFRAHLLGSVADFCTDSGLPLATPEVVAELVVRLARYREEGTDLMPEVYLTENIDDLVRMLPGGEKVPLAKASKNGNGIERMLKITAPLATGDWKVYGHETGDELDFGVFRGSPSPVAVDVDDIAMGEQQRLATVKVHRVANECVQIRSSEGTEHHIFLDASKQDVPPPLRHLEHLAAAIVRSMPAPDKEAVQTLFNRALSTALGETQGCIIAVANRKDPHDFVTNDSVLLAEPIDVASMVSSLRNSPDPLAPLSKINSAIDLVRGMVCSDGATLFDDLGRLLAYRCFVQIPDESTASGGARSRAFSALTDHLGQGLSAAFMQSHDGLTRFEEVRDA